MKRSEGEKQGVGPEKGKKKSKRRMSKKREGTGGEGAIRAAMMNLCGSFGIVGLCKYLNFESRAGYVTK